MSGSGISWAICKSAHHPRQITMPTPTTRFLQAGCPACCPTNSVKALKAKQSNYQKYQNKCEKKTGINMTSMVIQLESPTFINMDNSHESTYVTHHKSTVCKQNTAQLLLQYLTIF